MSNWSAKSAGAPKLKLVDPVWAQIRAEAEEIAAGDPTLGGFIFGAVLNHETFDDALRHRLARRIGNIDISNDLVEQAIGDAQVSEKLLGEQARADILATFERDPACHRYIDPFLYHKGFMGFADLSRRASVVENGPQGFCPASAKP